MGHKNSFLNCIKTKKKIQNSQKQTKKKGRKWEREKDEKSKEAEVDTITSWGQVSPQWSPAWVNVGIESLGWSYGVPASNGSCHLTFAEGENRAEPQTQ